MDTSLKQFELFSMCQPLPWCGCWIWMGGVEPTGYGRVHIDGKAMKAHRYVYSQLVGPLLPGHEIAHKHNCASKACVNPEHLMQLAVKEHRMYDQSAGQRKAGPPPATFKLQIHIPWELYQQMLNIAGHGGEHFNGRIYGGLSKIVILALRQYLAQAQQQPKSTMNLEDI